jgi:hypothetical protein
MQPTALDVELTHCTGIQIAKPLDMETTMSADRKGRKPWNTPDFELKFREAMGRDMTHQEREFFGLLDEQSASDDEPDPETDRTPNGTQFGWQSLRRLSGLLG